MSSDVSKIFEHFFTEYKIVTGKTDLRYVITSTYREGNVNSNPHAIQGNALDFTLRLRNQYAPISEYNDLFAYMIDNWPFRAGIDNTWKNEKRGNVHIHIDLGQNRPDGQNMPYFFKENHGKWLYQITSSSQV